MLQLELVARGAWRHRRERTRLEEVNDFGAVAQFLEPRQIAGPRRRGPPPMLAERISTLTARWGGSQVPPGSALVPQLASRRVRVAGVLPMDLPGRLVLSQAEEEGWRNTSDLGSIR